MKTQTLFRVALAALLLAALSVGLLPVAAQEAGGGKSIASVLKPFVDKHIIAGAVTLVADGEKILDLDAIGYADLEAQTMMGTNALFWIASQSKPITAAALMLLVDDGLLKLDDPVKNYLPEFNNQWQVVEKGDDQVLLKKPKTPVTVRHILSHTSGMPFKSDMEQPT